MTASEIVEALWTAMGLAPEKLAWLSLGDAGEVAGSSFQVDLLAQSSIAASSARSDGRISSARSGR